MDNALEKTGISEAEARRLDAAVSDASSSFRAVTYVVPVYRELRQRGYAHIELIR